MKFDLEKTSGEVKRVLNNVSFRFVYAIFTILFLISQPGCNDNQEIAGQNCNSSAESQTFQRASDGLEQERNALSDEHSVTESSIFLGRSIDMLTRIYRTELKYDINEYDYYRDAIWYHSQNFREECSFYDGIIVQIEAYIVKRDQQHFYFEFRMRHLGSNPYCFFAAYREKPALNMGARILLYTENDNENEANILSEISQKILLESVYETYDQQGVKYEEGLLLKPRINEHTEIDRALRKNATDDVFELYLKNFQEGNIPCSNVKNVASTDVIILRFHHPQFTNQLLDQFKNGVVTLYIQFGFAIGPWRSPEYLHFRFPILETQ